MTLFFDAFKRIGKPSALRFFRSCSGNGVYCSAIQPSINGWKVVVVRLWVPEAAVPRSLQGAVAYAAGHRSRS